jgi:hypothetical protein
MKKIMFGAALSVLLATGVTEVMAEIEEESSVLTFFGFNNAKGIKVIEACGVSVEVLKECITAIEECRKNIETIKKLIKNPPANPTKPLEMVAREIASAAGSNATKILDDCLVSVGYIHEGMLAAMRCRKLGDLIPKSRRVVDNIKWFETVMKIVPEKYEMDVVPFDVCGALSPSTGVAKNSVAGQQAYSLGPSELERRSLKDSSSYVSEPLAIYCVLEMYKALMKSMPKKPAFIGSTITSAVGLTVEAAAAAPIPTTAQAIAPITNQLNAITAEVDSKTFATQQEASVWGQQQLQTLTALGTQLSGIQVGAGAAETAARNAAVATYSTLLTRLQQQPKSKQVTVYTVMGVPARHDTVYCY